MAEAEHPLLLLGTASNPLPAAPSAAAAWPLPFTPGTAALQAASCRQPAPAGLLSRWHSRQLPAKGLCWLAAGQGDGGSRDRHFLTLSEMRQSESGTWRCPNRWGGLGQDVSPPRGAFPPGCVLRDRGTRGWWGQVPRGAAGMQTHLPACGSNSRQPGGSHAHEEPTMGKNSWRTWTEMF